MYHLKIKFEYATLERISENENELQIELDKYKGEGYNGTIVKLEESSYNEVVESIKVDVDRLSRDGSGLH